MFRPWGIMDTLLLNEARPVTIKWIHMFPGSKMSLQSHKKRDQLYLITSDSFSAKLSYGTRRDTLITLTPKQGQLFYFPRLTLHRMENPGAVTYSFIEISLGVNDEEDITRHDDEYGRIDEKVFKSEDERMLDLSLEGREQGLGPGKYTSESGYNRGGPWRPGIDP
jgi:mannose-1-phosphate guanylyltransferase/mannose-6-phosphate isomerase